MFTKATYQKSNQFSKPQTNPPSPGEHTSLNAIHAAVPSLCPKSYAHGKLTDFNGSFLVTDYLDMNSRASPSSSHSQKSGSGMSLAEKLAKLHSTPVEIPEGYDRPQFGFPVPTCCGDTVQENKYRYVSLSLCFSLVVFK